MTATTPQTLVANLRDSLTVAIASGASLSDAGRLYGHTLVGIVMPAAWTAASLTFQASLDGATFFNLHEDSGTERTVQADAGRFVALAPMDWLGIEYVRLRSGTAAAAVNQGAARTITLVLAP